MKAYCYTGSNGKVWTTTVSSRLTTPEQIEQALAKAYLATDCNVRNVPVTAAGGKFDPVRTKLPPTLDVVEVDEAEMPARNTRADWRVEGGQLKTRPGLGPGLGRRSPHSPK